MATPSLPSSSPVPTPYDIIDIPSFPYVPSLAAWALFIVLSAVLVAVVRYLAKRRATSSVNLSAYQILIDEVSALKNSASIALSKEDAFRLSSLIRRYITSIGGRPIEHLSNSELLVAIGDVPDGTPLHRLIEIVLELEKIKYRPDGKMGDPARFIDGASLTIMAYHESLTAPSKSKRGAP